MLFSVESDDEAQEANEVVESDNEAQEANEVVELDEAQDKAVMKRLNWM